MEMQAEKDLISILMPTYNVEQFVEEAVRSILAQTYEQLELIIVDDCSTDRTYEILQRLQEEDTRIKLYRNETNSKICKTLNRAFRYAKGAYIGRMDGDDISTPERFEIMKQFLDGHMELALVGSNMITVDEVGKEIAKKRYIKTNTYIQKGNQYQPCVAHIWLAKREIYETLGGYREVPGVEDWDFLLRGENADFQYANVDAYVYKCRIRNGNTGSTNGLKQRKAGKYIYDLHKKEAKAKKNLFKEGDYSRALVCTEVEQKNYQKAANDLNIAIHSRENKLKLMRYALKAFFESKYIAKYLFDVTMIRLLLQLENKKLYADR